MANNKHLIIDDRITISQMLRERKSFMEIGESLNKDPSTISKEIRNHIILSKTGCHGHAYNNCIHRYTCDEACLCDECINRRLINRCRFCKQCNDHCDQYEPDSCLKLKKPPYVCNGCPDAHHKCTLEKHMYVAKEAQLSYEDTLHTCRTGINFSEDEVKHLDDVISPLLRKGHSIHNVYAHHKDEVMISESSVYRLVDYGLLSAKNIDLPRKVRFAPRKKKKNFKVDRSCRIGRTYEDYQLFMQEHPEYHVVEMVHLGYLTYDNLEKRVRIPNKEVQNEFRNLLRNANKTKLYQLVQASEQLLKDTLDGREDQVAKSIEAIRESSYAPAYYNDEQALRYVIRFAYIVCVDQFLRIEELPSGKGVADVVYLPRKQSPLPAMVIELKWNKTADAAIRQILNRNYPQILKEYIGEIVLVAISYDEKTKKHSCRIIRERL